MSRYTVEPGRHIYRDGKPFIYIGRPDDGAYPTEADLVTHTIAACLNFRDEVSRALAEDAQYSRYKVSEK